MEDQGPITLNTDALRRGRAERGLSHRQLSRMTDIRLVTLLGMEKGGPCDRVTLGMLSKLADALGIEPAALLGTTRDEVPPEPDDVQVEAALAQTGKLVNSDDLAWALGWDIERTRRALLALEQRLRTTGQRLRKGSYGWFGLSAARGVLSTDAAAAVERATFSESGIQRGHAQVLLQIAAGAKIHNTRPDSGKRVWRGPDTVGRLLRANLIGPTDDGLGLNPDVAFSLCLENVPLCEPTPVRPQMRGNRAPH